MRKYSVLDNMTLEVASILVYALCKEWYNEKVKQSSSQESQENKQ